MASHRGSDLRRVRPPTTADARRRVVWATAGAAPPERVLADLAVLADVHVVAGDLPPGEAPLDGGGAVSGEGVDWLWTPYPLARLPGAARLVRRMFAVVGRPFERVHFADRDREIARAVARRRRAGDVDLVIADGVGVTAALVGLGLPVVALEPSGAAGRGVDRWAANRWLRRTFAAVEVVAPDEIVERVASEAPRAGPPAGAVVRPATASVVVATANRPDLLRTSLPALAAAAESVPGTAVIVVEQGPPAARGICEQLGIAADVVYDPGRGVSRARNLGAQRATSDVVLFTDDDCIVPASWVGDHLDAFDGRVAATFGPVRGLPRAIVADDPVARPRRHRAGAMPWHVGHGSNMAVRRDVLLALGGWDERIGPGTPLPAGEDADLIVRLLENGGVARSGVGSAVEHLPWRTADAERDTARAYELGAGVWIGKALRRLGGEARPYLRGRRRLHRIQRDAAGRPAVATFVRGLVHGWRLG